ncbi:choice-of-anchor L domain-containing protein [Coleofasciculus sp. A1-SPW-01]|uniref:choice-of-anchor L domain-containing protein n=1 Tax=Coleofasciculus sp. A1-SPW-01 TaxID=3070819 RepID=UPI004064356D
MGLLPIKTTTTTIATTALLSLWGLPAMAFTITPTSDTDLLLNSLLGYTTGLSNIVLTVYDDQENVNDKAFGTFSDDPFGLGEGIVLSTGRVDELPGPNTEDGGLVPTEGDPNDLSTDFDPPSPPPADSGNSTPEDRAIGMQGDDITLKISFDVDNTAEKLFFQYIFGSEEFVEFGGTEFNDSFKMLLNGINLAKLSDGQEVTINNLVPDPQNPDLYHDDYVNNPAELNIANTKLDGFTQLLTFEGLLEQNSRNTLIINVKDKGDGLYDSAVFIKGKSLGTKPPQLNPQPEPNDDPSDEPQSPSDDPVTDPGTDPGNLFPPDDPEPQSVPEPSGLLGLLGVATLGVRTMIRRKQKAHLQEH